MSTLLNIRDFFQHFTVGVECFILGKIEDNTLSHFIRQFNFPICYRVQSYRRRANVLIGLNTFTDCGLVL